MTVTETPVCDFDKDAVPFSLQDFAGKTWDLDSVKGENGLLVMFICNHCPYVKRIIDNLVMDCKKLQENGIGCVAIMSNDYADYPEDSSENMAIFSKVHNLSFPYLIDETQEVAKSYGAVCTPDFFGYNKDLKLQYRGKFENALLEGMLQVASTNNGPKEQVPSMGCSIKWK
jgi:peroxiredoxin